jgi:hypothetical protein
MGMVTRAGVVVDAFALDAVKTYLRIDGESEDSALAALIVAAVEQCEAYVGAAVLQRAMTEVIVPGAAWQLLTPAPVRVGARCGWRCLPRCKPGRRRRLRKRGWRGCGPSGRGQQ